MTYSTQQIKLTVTISEVDGALVAEAAYEDGDGADKNTITNKYAVGRLSMEKRVVSPIKVDHTDKLYHFAVHLTDEVGSKLEGTFGDMVFTPIQADGDLYSEATFDLKDGEIRIASGLPVGVEYTVIELSDEDKAAFDTEAGANLESLTEGDEYESNIANATAIDIGPMAELKDYVLAQDRQAGYLQGGCERPGRGRR